MMKCFVNLPYCACSSEYSLERMEVHHSLTAAINAAKEFLVDLIYDDGHGEEIGLDECEWYNYPKDGDPYRGSVEHGDDVVRIYDVPLKGFE
jgi:hypothetical protein